MDDQLDPSRVAALSPQQLDSMRQNTEQDVEGLKINHAILSRAQAEYRSGITAAKDLENAAEGTDMLLPLTDSLYIPAKLGNPKKLLVEIGTGFVVEKTPEQASEFCERKINVISDNLDTIQEMIRVKNKNVKMLDYVLQQKVEQIKRQQGQR